jgi:acetophenone carboxylase
LERDPEAVIKDLREGLATPWAAKNVYHVIYDEETLRLDPERTRAARERVREERKGRGKPYDEFEAEWSTLRPPKEVLTYYGAYPNPSRPTGSDAS